MPERRPRRAPSKKAKASPREAAVAGAPLEPIRVIERELTRPDGTKLRVKVPVYPPFRLLERPPKGEARRKAPEKKAG